MGGLECGEGRRGPQLVKPETPRKLHTPVISMPDQKNLAHILLQPRRDFGMVLVSNIAGAKADQAIHAPAE